MASALNSLHYFVGSLNNCAFISGCIQYSETECDSEGKRQACITWGNPNGAGGCVLTAGSDVIDTACRESKLFFLLF